MRYVQKIERKKHVQIQTSLTWSELFKGEGKPISEKGTKLMRGPVRETGRSTRKIDPNRNASNNMVLKA